MLTGYSQALALLRRNEHAAQEGNLGGGSAGRRPVQPVRASWRGAVLAESPETVEIEGNHYFPPDSVNYQHLIPSEHHTTCWWKGRASYYHVRANGELNENAAWYYPDPKEAAEEIKGYVAFWKGVRVG